MSRLHPLSAQQTQTVLAELGELGKRVAQVGTVIGPALGAAWCDQALNIERHILSLRMSVDDMAYAQRRAGRFAP